MANPMSSVMGAFAELERSLTRERQREGIPLAKLRGAYKGRKKTLTLERAAELFQRAGSGVPKAVFARDYGINRETVYQYLRHAKLGVKPLPCRSRPLCVAEAAMGFGHKAPNPGAGATNKSCRAKRA
jgi:DNA invertase Pin-like site-specific DNA recombinase